MKLIELLGKALGFLRVLAAGTTTTVDDQAVEFLQAIYDSPALLQWFEGVLKTAPHDPTTGTLALTDQPPEAIMLELRDRKIDWTKLAEYLPVLIQIVRAFAG